MSEIVGEDFESPDTVVELLELTLGGGFVDGDELNDDLEHLSKHVNWIESAVKCKCECGEWHTAREREGSYECPLKMHPVEPDVVREGIRQSANLSPNFDVELEYELEVAEHTSIVEISEFDDMAIVFAPDVENLEFPDRVGRVVWLPVEDLPKIVDVQEREDLLVEIREKRKELIDWGRLDSQGNMFEEITYRLIDRDDQFHSLSWGGNGPDQGKDAFCSIDLVGRDARILVEAKGRPDSTQSENDIHNYVRRAKRHNCEGLLLSAINISGDAESANEANAYQTDSVPIVRIWSGVDIKERLSQHPDLITEYFIN